jgi:hypothetical protein
MKLRCLLLALALAASGTSAWGHDSDTPFADWMKTLMQPDLPLSSCCGVNGGGKPGHMPASEPASSGRCFLTVGIG